MGLITSFSFFFLFVFLLAIAILIDWYIAKQFEEAARKKGYNDNKYVWICFFFSIVGYLLVIALPDRGDNR